jgi:bifunctional DNase/RNase
MSREDAIPMNVGGLTLDPATKTPIVILRDDDNKLNLPIWIGLLEATAIATELEGIQMARPMTHDLLRNLIGELGATVESIEISDLRENTYYAVIHLRIDGPRAPSTRGPATPSRWRCASRARSTWRARCSRPPACCSRARKRRRTTSPTSRPTSGPRFSRKCRRTTSSTRCDIDRRAARVVSLSRRPVWAAPAFLRLARGRRSWRRTRA